LFACHFLEVKNSVIAVNAMNVGSVFSAVGLIDGLFLLTHVLQICKKNKINNININIPFWFTEMRLYL